MSPRDEVSRQAGRRFEDRSARRAANLELLAGLKAGGVIEFQPLDSVERLAVRAEQLGLTEDAAELRAGIDDTAGQRVFEKILGANNLLDSTFLTRGAEVARAVGRITMPVPGGTRLGTGFMVSPRVMMTNNHVIESRSQAAAANLEFDFFDRGDGTTGPVIRFGLDPDALFVTDAALDFTLVAVNQTSSNGINVTSRGFLPLIGPSGKAIVGERVSIIQHPNGDPQKVVVHDNQVSDVNPDDDFLHYQTDTMGGSSGSPVLNINWHLAALHHAAVGNDNEGIRISSIVNRLNQLFANEAATANLDRHLLQQTLTPPPSNPPPPPHNPPPPHADPTTAPTGAHLNPDGTVTWTLPINVTLGLGHQPPPPPTPRTTPTPTDNNELRDALQALEDTAGRTYYSQVKDGEAVARYYPDLGGLNPADLYDTLSALLTSTHTTTLSYRTARLGHLYPWIDRREGPERLLKGIYSNQEFEAAEVIRQEVIAEQLRAEAIERLRLEAADPDDLDDLDDLLETLEAAHPFNCEHVVPQSWFNKRKQPKTDLHHLFTCEWGCNSFRGNHAYDVFEQEAVRENCGRREAGRFEPNAGKGAVARATLYFLVRYPGDIADSAKEMPQDRLPTLVEWATNDRVDRWERHRNAEIAKVQGNRNPFIDFPDLVNDVDFTRGWA